MLAALMAREKEFVRYFSAGHRLWQKKPYYCWGGKDIIDY
jgi:hypothetical protein